MLKIRKFTSVEERCPLVMITPDGLTVTKGGQFAQVVELTGKDYSGLDDEVVEGLFQTRKMFFESLSDRITVFLQSHRQKLSRDIDSGSFSIPIAGDIAEQWSTNFKTSFRTRHFLVFVTASDAFQEQLSFLSASGESATDELKRVLKDTVDDCLVRFEGYGAHKIKGDELASYWGWMINGRHVYQKLPANGLIDGLLSGTALKWPNRKRYQLYDGDPPRYSTWLIIKSPANTTSNGLLDSLFQVKREFSLFQTFSTFEKKDALDYLEDRRRNIAAFTRGGDIIIDELNELEHRVQADELSLTRHRWALEIFADSEQELDQAAHEIKNTIEQWGYRAAREKINQEALFWSRFPEMHNFNPRQTFPTSENCSHFATFASVGEGLESCSWGQAPVTLFKTMTGSEFSFTFHGSTAKDALGNTLVIGGSEAGKTTLISFLFSQCFKFPNFKALAFDRLHGLEVFTRFHDGEYIDFEGGLELNPLQLSDSGENRAFLNEWLQMLTGRSGEKDLDTIGQAIVQLFNTLDKPDRNLANLADAFGLQEEDSVRQALNRWLPGQIFGDYFSGKKDALEFNKPLVTLDMSTILDTPEILGSLTYYLFHKLFQTVGRADCGYAVFVDELPRYLASKEFAPRIEMLLQEIRKTDGVFIGAAQDAGSVLDHPIASKIQNNMATYILFPEPRAKKEHYMTGLGLNQAEFDWIKVPKVRQALLKRKGGESIILDVNLAPLGNYLKIFNSGASAIRRCNDLRKGNPHDWKNDYLNS
jgi:type IV secretion/conjugal transfer VirB4 family ATPase